MDESVRQLVRERAGAQCEYCRLPQQEGASVRFHIEHVRPRQHGGDDNPTNLALACPNCNWNKGPNLSAIDPETDTIAPLYNPRSDRWTDHFAFVDAEIVGLTKVGRATVRLLRLNNPEFTDIRREMMLRGELEIDG